MLLVSCKAPGPPHIEQAWRNTIMTAIKGKTFEDLSTPTGYTNHQTGWWLIMLFKLHSFHTISIGIVPVLWCSDLECPGSLRVHFFGHRGFKLIRHSPTKHGPPWNWLLFKTSVIKTRSHMNSPCHCSNAPCVFTNEKMATYRSKPTTFANKSRFSQGRIFR